MSEMLSAKIDLSKIDESRLFSGKNGARYLDITLIPVRESKYGESHFIVQDIGKEERLAGKKGAILGNAKTLGGDGRGKPASSARPIRPLAGSEAEEQPVHADTEVPF